MRGLALPWKKPKPGADGQDTGCNSDQGEDGMRGSMATWYDGREAALLSLAQQRMGLGSKPFTFKSRAKHSAYKECTLCQEGRLDVAEAIRRNLGPDEIKRRKDHLASHLQWMYRQRAELERITQMSAHEGCVVENSDKCGDHCLYAPASARASSANVSKYRYRLSLQANVYAGKLFNLMFLLPNLKTGADFGISSFLAGFCRMFQLGEVTNQTRRLLRGMDGGSENINFAGLGMNSLLVKELHEGSITEVQQHRLPPDHSHTFWTDGTFSVIEGFLTHDGFPGCATVWDMIAYLRRKFAGAEKYLDKRVEITCLLVTFAFTKFFDGHIHADKIKGIGTPLRTVLMAYAGRMCADRVCAPLIWQVLRSYGDTSGILSARRWWFTSKCHLQTLQPLKRTNGAHGLSSWCLTTIRRPAKSSSSRCFEQSLPVSCS
jgi:hypothetical protein